MNQFSVSLTLSEKEKASRLASLQRSVRFFGVCKGSNPAKFLDIQNNADTGVREICASCPAKTACLDVALNTYPYPSGYVGGTSYKERRKIRHQYDIKPGRISFVAGMYFKSSSVRNKRQRSPESLSQTPRAIYTRKRREALKRREEFKRAAALRSEQGGERTA